MNCPQCNGLLIVRQATKFGDEYPYCRTCKKELSEMQSPEVPATLPKGQMNEDLEISAMATRAEIEAARKLAKGNLIFVLPDDLEIFKCQEPST